MRTPDGQRMLPHILAAAWLRGAASAVLVNAVVDFATRAVCCMQAKSSFLVEATEEQRGGLVEMLSAAWCKALPGTYRVSCLPNRSSCVLHVALNN
jgi:hypothetical protein